VTPPESPEQLAVAIADADRRLAAEVKRAEDLERENTRLRRIVADRDLEIEMLREVSRGTY
jgi:hypothetical protein